MEFGGLARILLFIGELVEVMLEGTFDCGMFVFGIMPM